MFTVYPLVGSWTEPVRDFETYEEAKEFAEEFFGTDDNYIIEED